MSSFYLPPTQFSSSRAEMSLVACLISDSSHIPRVLARLTPEDFTDPVAEIIFTACAQLHARGYPVDRVTLAAQINANRASELDDLVDFDQLEERALPAWKIDEYATLIHDFGQARALDLAQAIETRVRTHRLGDPPLDAALREVVAKYLPQEAALLPQDPAASNAQEATADALCRRPLAGPAWLLEDLFIAGGLNLLAGEVASGKTFLALDLALAVASGQPAWDGRPALRGPVLYFCLDCSPQTVQKRLLALCAGRGIAPPKDLVLNFSALNLAEESGLAYLRQRVAACQACLVVCDVLARYMPGVDENTVASVGPVMTGLRQFANQTGCSVLILHHYNKGVGYAAQAGRGLRVRGSIDITGSMDAVVTVTYSADGRRITPEKNREQPEAGPMRFEITAGKGEGLRVEVVSQAEGEAQKAKSLVEWVVGLLKAHPAEVFTRRQIAEAMKQAGVRFSNRSLERTLAETGKLAGVRADCTGKTYTYAWGGRIDLRREDA